MSRFLVVGLPRTGTSVLCELLAEQYQCRDLGEKWCIDSLDLDVRRYRNDVSIFKKYNLDPSKDFIHHIYFNEHKKRFNELLNNDKWIAKIWTYDLLSYDKKMMIEQCSLKDVKILLTHRKNIIEHFNSIVHAINRSRIVSSMKDIFFSKSGEYTMFNINTNYHLNDKEFEKWSISDRELNNQFVYFVNNLVTWRLIYDLYKDQINLVSYEEEIKPLSLSAAGITSETVDRYNEKEVHLVPTFMSNNILSENDSYNECVNLLKNYQYLVEI